MPSLWVLVVAAGLILSVAVVYFVYQPASIAWAVTLALAVAALLAVVAGSTPIRVGARELVVGRNRLESTYIGDARSLSVEETRRRLGPEADVRAFLCTRPYLSRAVEVTLDDPADPHPYWLVGTRHPEELADAIRRSRP